jgi:hypothetical protein
MPKITFSLNDVNDELSVAYAKARGYTFTLHGDGNAEIANGIGHVCRVHRFKCDCPDKRSNIGAYNGRCQHEIWVAQLLPCDVCDGIMGLGVFFSCFGAMMERFECPSCGNVRDFELVRVERGMRSQMRAQKKTPETAS